MLTLYNIALSKIKGIGSATTRNLLLEYDNSKQIFETPQKDFQNRTLAKLLSNENKDKALSIANKELSFIKNKGITPIFLTDKQYPLRLKDCKGAPIILYTKGKTNLNNIRCLSIIGTRQPTQEGIAITQKLVDEIAQTFPNTLIVSGLAYGVDITAHKSALANNLPTLAVLGHGLHKIYPAIHKNIADQIIKNNGSILSQYTSDMPIVRQNFIQRNSIVAGVSDATIVIESQKKGGAMTTALIANSFGRDVLAVPGTIHSEKSKGCNHLIKTNIAALIEGVEDIGYALGWDTSKQEATQQQLFFDLSAEEQTVVDFLQKGKCNIDELSILSKIPTHKLLTLLTQLEFKGIIAIHPGKFYSIRK